jgi:hypothetical protein
LLAPICISNTKYKVDGFKVECAWNDGSWAHFIFNEIIPYNNIYTFKVKIIKNPDKHMMIGVVDFMKQKDKI